MRNFEFGDEPGALVFFLFPALLASVSAEMGGASGSSEGGKEPFFVKDPQKALRNFFERYGEEPEYQDEERTVNKRR